MMEDVESRCKLSRRAGHAGLSEFTKKDQERQWRRATGQGIDGCE